MDTGCLCLWRLRLAESSGDFCMREWTTSFWDRMRMQCF